MINKLVVLVCFVNDSVVEFYKMQSAITFKRYLKWVTLMIELYFSQLPKLWPGPQLVPDTARDKDM